MKKTRYTLLQSLIALVLCVSMLVGSTFAWFTDSVSSVNNQIVAGTLDVQLEYLDDGSWETVDAQTVVMNKDALWEPGYTEVVYLRITNGGNLALKYALGVGVLKEIGSINAAGQNFYLSDYIRYGLIESGTEPSYATREDALKDLTSSKIISEGTTSTGAQLNQNGDVRYVTLVVYMPEDVGNVANYATGVTPPEIELGLKLIATQAEYELDSFGPGYDQGAGLSAFDFPGTRYGVTTSAGVEKDANNQSVGAVSLIDKQASAEVPAGVQLEQGANILTLEVTSMTADQSNANITLKEHEDVCSLDVHVKGIAKDNTVPMAITIKEAAPKNLNMGNYQFYHVENGETKEMTLVAANEEFSAHNQFKYDPFTGDITLYMATFSEIAMVADTTGAWEGNFDYSWYNNAVMPTDGEAVTEYIIANADQLAAFGAIVGGMNGQTQDSFAGKTVKLVGDINLGDAEGSENDFIFYPIGYNSDDGKYEKTGVAVTTGFYNFCGTFDGNGHTIANFYQNTWEMKGDNEYYAATEQRYRDGMGLFGRVYGGTIKNLTVRNFKSDGEYTTTGVIAAYADGATFENIAIFDCTPRVYNIGNGGIVGCVGWYAKEANLKTTFKNITVDNSNKISALWGSYDVACGGIVGQYYPTSGQSSAGKPANGGIHFENCHISAQMDVYNDVCANYQYYAYRYTGMLIGSVRENVTIDGHVYPKMDGITASGCTVHFGTWNDYYYCEIIDNTTASYTHDYQMSRLVQVKAVNGTTITPLEGDSFSVPSSGRYNYVVVTTTENGDWNHGTENATCYHFKDGKVWNHEDGGKETVNGVEVLKEDKQHIHLEFSNLVTGYGWGVTTKVVGDLEGVTILDREVGDSKVKFEKSDTAKDSYMNGKPIQLGELFKAAKLDDEKLSILNASVSVTVSPVGEESTAGGSYVANTTDWTQGSLTFTGNGAATITITDYYFCTPTTITVNITERQPEVKFENKFTGKFLYRVGNANPVALNSLFAAVEGADIGTVDVTIEQQSGTANGEYTCSTSPWDNGTIKFSGTGVVKVTIQDDNFCKPTELYLEVVDAYNATTSCSAPHTYNGVKYNVILLNNVVNGSFSVAAGYGFYGNGFTITLNPASHTTKRGAGFDGYIHMTGGTLDNVRIEGPTFAAANIYREQGQTGTGTDDPVNYFRNGVIIDSGDVIISNSYLSGARTALYVKGAGSVVVENTTVSGGAYANIEISAANAVTLRNVKTVQKVAKDSYGNNKDMIGLAIVVNNADTKLILDGVTQDNWMDETQWSRMLGSYVSQFPRLFTDTTYSKLWHNNIEGIRVVNTGIIWACDVTEPEMQGEITGYGTAGITLAGTNGIVYTMENGGDNNKVVGEVDIPDYGSDTQSAIPPIATFDYTTKNYQQYVDGEDAYCYYDAGVVKIGFTKGGSKVWDPMILSVKKDDKAITDYEVTMNGMDYTNKHITFTEAGDYQVVYTYDDPYNYKYNAENKLVSYSVKYTETVYITVNVAEEQAKNAEFTMNSQTVDKIQVGDKTYLSATGVNTADLIKTNNFSNSPVSGGIKHNYDGITKKGWGCLTISGQTVYFPIVPMLTTDGTFEHKGSWYGCFPVFEGIIEIKDYADQGTAETPTVYNGSTTTMPATLKALDPQNYFVYQGTVSKVPTTPAKVTKGGYKDKLCYTTQTDLTASNERGEVWTLATYTYTDNKGATYYWYVGYYCAASTNGCVTPDTLITLADGSQVRVDSLKGNEELLVWNLETGKYEAAPIVFVDNDAEAEYEIIHLYFSDGSDVKVISEHGFFDLDLGEYVYIDASNYADYIGHRFVTEGDIKANNWNVVTLDEVVIETEVTTAWSPVTFEHLCYYTNGVLSMPGGIEGLFNIFEVDTDRMIYDAEKMQKDIETYGLFTIEDFGGMITEDAFNAFNGAYLKVAMGKGLLTWEDIAYMAERYIPLM